MSVSARHESNKTRPTSGRGQSAHRKCGGSDSDEDIQVHYGKEFNPNMELKSSSYLFPASFIPNFINSSSSSSAHLHHLLSSLRANQGASICAHENVPFLYK